MEIGATASDGDGYRLAINRNYINVIEVVDGEDVIRGKITFQ